MNYASTIKKLREAMLLTQAELAEHLGVSFESVNRWENGKNQPTMKMKRKIVALCKEYGIEVTANERT